MSYGQYGNNRFDQREEQPGYGAPSPRYGGPAMGRDDYEGSNVEMEPLTGTGSSFPRQTGPKDVLLECTATDARFAEIREQITVVDGWQTRILNSANSSELQGPLEQAMARFTDLYADLTRQYTMIKQMPGSGSNIAVKQVERVKNNLENVKSEYQAVLYKYQRGMTQQAERQYLIVNPDASRDEIDQALSEGGEQMFANALKQGSRSGQAQSALGAVKQRNQELKKIESQMIELSELFQQMGQLVEQQEEAVTQIEMKGEEVNENMEAGTKQIGVAIESARNTRKWKWWCLGIVVLIIVIIVIVVLIYKFVIQSNTTTTTAATTKRFVLSDSIPANKLSTAGHAMIPGKEWKPASKVAVPGLAWKDDRLVMPGVEYVAGAKRSRRFQA